MVNMWTDKYFLATDMKIIVCVVLVYNNVYKYM